VSLSINDVREALIEYHGDDPAIERKKAEQ